MKNPKSLITKIALGVSVAAFIFSIVTLVRNIIIQAMVGAAVIQTIGTAIIVVICLFLLYSLRQSKSEEEKEPEYTEEEEEPAQPTEEQSDISEDLDRSFDSFVEDNPDYDLSLFKDDDL